MRLFQAKDKSIGDHLFSIRDSVSRTEVNVENIKDGFSEHVKAGYKQRETDKIWQKSIEDKIDQCPEKERINGIETALNEKLNVDMGKATTWKVVALVISAMAGTVVTLVNIFKWKPWD